jgi:hypothetical protein
MCSQKSPAFAGAAASRDHLAGRLFMLRQERAVIALAKPAAPQCAGGKVTVADEFTIESISARTIIVRHVAHDHRYAFYVMKEPRRRLLCVGPVQTGRQAPLPRSSFQRAARSFAEREARKAGMID